MRISSEQTQTGDRRSPNRGKRRAATAMEYLVAASFILVVLIIGVQQVGSAALGLFTTSAEASNKATKAGE